MGADFEDFLRSHAEYPKLNCLRFEKSSLKEFPRSLWNKHLVSIFGEVSNVGFDDGALHRMNEVFENRLVNMYKTQEKVTGLFARKEKVIAKTQEAVERLIVMSFLGPRTGWEAIQGEAIGEVIVTPLEQNLRTQLLGLQELLQKPESAQKEAYLKQAKAVKRLFQEYFGTFPPGRQALLKRFIKNDLDQLSQYHKKMK